MSASTKWILELIEKKMRAGDHFTNPAEMQVLIFIAAERNDLSDDDIYFLEYVKSCVEYQMEFADESV